MNVNPGDDIVDWVLVEFRETMYGAASATSDKMINRQAALMIADGSIKQTDGINPLEYLGDITQNLFVIIRHRNHLAVMSAVPLVPVKGEYFYDFTDELSKAY